MTLIDLIKLGVVKSHRQAERMAADLVDCWHNHQIPGELHDVLGLTLREYQAWTTGGVSLLTIARWHQNSRPALAADRPWFKLSGKPPLEIVGYLEAKAKKPKRPGRPPGSGLYDWDNWFSRSRFRLQEGKHYLCSQATMSQNIRNEASNRGVYVHLSYWGKRITVLVSKKPFLSPSPRTAPQAR